MKNISKIESYVTAFWVDNNKKQLFLVRVLDLGNAMLFLGSSCSMACVEAKPVLLQENLTSLFIDQEGSVLDQALPSISQALCQQHSTTLFGSHLPVDVLMSPPCFLIQYKFYNKNSLICVIIIRKNVYNLYGHVFMFSTSL